MGQDVKGKSFTQKDFDLFSSKLQNETKILLDHFEKKEFVNPETPLCGLEMEAWLINNDSLPNPVAEKFLNKMNDPFIVPEISQFNFEVNTAPALLSGKVFSEFHTS